MKTKIAVFGRTEILNRVNILTEEYDNVEILPFVYAHSSEVTEIIESALMCDVYLFTEPLSYLYAREKIEKEKLPAVLVAHNEYMILGSLYKRRDIRNQKHDRISIDIPNRKHMSEVIKEFGGEEQEFYYYSYEDDDAPDIDKIVAFHKKLWDDGSIDYVLSSSKEVESHMKHSGIPASTMIIPDILLNQAIQEAKSLTILNRNKGALLVTGYIRLKETGVAPAENSRTYEENIYQLKQILTDFGKQTDALLVHNRSDQFVMVGTKKLLDHLQNHYREFPLLSEIQSTLSMAIDMGFGLGLTAEESQKHAHLALDKCSKDNRSICYITNERKDTIGPIGIMRDIDTSRLFQALIHKAKLNNELSYNFIDFITDRNNEPFSSNDIATYYKVTKRSAERTVNKLLTGDVIKVSGEERPYLKGRPRKLFTIKV
ncbi:hypothetical protein [Oceanobacillus rekensis]|uniref:hypothetical protein n=1 Tax=Oceanobacillus rekensis TaxID=937927 RepID=UPI000B44D523|nr:hypothetical protein [Oceanobacillus rekensis]